MVGNPSDIWDRTDYYYSWAWQVVEEKHVEDQSAANKDNVATNAKFQYIWDIRYIDAPVIRDADTDSDGDCVEDGGSERLYYTQDANFNTTALVATDGSVAERYVYDAYGKVTIYDDDWSDTVSWTNSKKNEILYAGYRFDPETGNYHVRHRMYHPSLGRWLQRDPIGYTDGLNLYEYTRSSPADSYSIKGTEHLIIG